MLLKQALVGEEVSIRQTETLQVRRLEPARPPWVRSENAGWLMWVGREGSDCQSPCSQAKGTWSLPRRVGLHYLVGVLWGFCICLLKLRFCFLSGPVVNSNGTNLDLFLICHQPSQFSPEATVPNL